VTQQERCDRYDFLRVSDRHSSQAERKQQNIGLQAAAVSDVQNRFGIPQFSPIAR
jgi:hypothetical protein